MDRMKMLFSDAPPDALQNLLSPRRKLLYGLFAFGPGTGLGLYLYTVKKRMERENEAMRLEQVESELNIVQERHDKDLVLANALQEMRDRLQRLEDETTASRLHVASRKAETETTPSVVKEVSAPIESKIDVALALLKSDEYLDEKEQRAAAVPSSFEGSQRRRDQHYQEILQQDIAAHIAKQQEQTK